MGKDKNAKVIPLKTTNKTSVSKSGKGVVVRKPFPIEEPDQKETIDEERTSDKTAQDDGPLLKQEEIFDLDRIEKELADLNKQESFIERLSRSFSEKSTLERLKNKKEELELRHQVRALIAEIEKQNVLVKKELLDLKTSLLEKVVMSHKDVQKLILDIKLKELGIEKLQKEIEKLNLEQIKKGLEKELEGHTGKDFEGAYSLKQFQVLSEYHGNEEDDEEDSSH